ncbi:hypothetical protein MUB52_18350 [Roseobacter sp. WL0113]|uniref:Uncharacterized protein n=2 Tax=Roseobacter sinensis TaxID=2931391 RepID=A0ABT3BIJ3_9RHOB|nr:hypothetical protein [Roseobacter sp. WL0113]
MLKTAQIVVTSSVLLCMSAVSTLADGGVVAASAIKARGLDRIVVDVLSHQTAVLGDQLDGREFTVPPVIVATDADDLWPLFQEHSASLNEEELSDAFKRRCTSPNDRAFGVFTGDAIALCVFLSETSAPEAERKFISIALAHELYHSVQFQSVGLSRLAEIDDTLDAFGPAWLMEGSAFYFGEFFGCDTCDLDIESVTDGVRELTSRITTPLSKLEYFSDDPRLADAMYYKGFLAAMMLAHDHGDGAILEFYHRMGEGHDWKSAFRSAFAEDITEFYVRFESG